MNAMFVTKNLGIQTPWYNIKDNTLERELMNVMLVQKNSCHLVIYQHIR